VNNACCVPNFKSVRVELLVLQSDPRSEKCPHPNLQD